MDEHEASPARPGSSLAGALAAVVGAAAMGASIPALRDGAASAPPQDVLLSWVLLGTAAVGVVLCAYLALIWSLAAVILLAGPASGLGAALLGPLRILAPRMARRVITGASAATAVTALAMTSSMAAPSTSAPAPSEEQPAASQTATLFSAELPTPAPAPDENGAGGVPQAGDRQTQGDADATGSPGSADPAQLPSLGWGDGASRTDQDGDQAATAPDPGAAPGSAPGTGAPSTGAPPTSPRTVVVHNGDSLWSITDDLLDPERSSPEEIADAWPRLHEVNKGVIGDDPDLLRPGQTLTIPSDLTTEDQS